MLISRQKHGGVILNNDRREQADVIIVNEDALKVYRRQYSASILTWAEGPQFVENCIKAGVYRHEIPPQRPMGGRAPGSG